MIDEIQLPFYHLLVKISDMCAWTKQGQNNLGYDLKVLIKLVVRFEQDIQSNIHCDQAVRLQ